MLCAILIAYQQERENTEHRTVQYRNKPCRSQCYAEPNKLMIKWPNNLNSSAYTTSIFLHFPHIHLPIRMFFKRLSCKSLPTYECSGKWIVLKTSIVITIKSISSSTPNRLYNLYRGIRVCSGLCS